MQRFYGGPPDAWLYVPRPLLTSYANAIPALRAEESLSRISDGRVGTLGMKIPQAMQHVRALQRAAKAGQRARPANPQRLRAAGIRVQVHKAGEP